MYITQVNKKKSHFHIHSEVHIHSGVPYYHVPSNLLPAEPAEERSAVSAGHLVAATSFLNHGVALGAALGVLSGPHPNKALHVPETRHSLG